MADYGKAALSQIVDLSQSVIAQAKKPYSKQTQDIKPLVTFYLDDGYQNDYDIVFPKAKALGFPLTICLFNTSALVSTPTRLNELVNGNSWELHSHTATHADLNTLTLEQQREEMRSNKEFFKNLGYELEGICYPKGYTNADTLKAAREFFKVGMSSNQAANSSPIDTYFVKRILTDSYDMASMKAMVDKIKADGKGWIVFYSHSNIFGTNTTIRDRYFEVMDYVKASGVEVATVKKAMRVYENTLDIGDTYYSKDYLKVGSDGSIDFSNIPIKVDAKNDAVNSRLGTDFPAGRMSINRFQISGTASDIPFDNGFGTLYTDRSFEKEGLVGSRATQRFEGVNGTIVYRNFNAGVWSDWVNYGSVNTVKTKAYTDSSPITDYPSKKVTTVAFNSTDASGFPDGGIGTLITSRMHSTDTINFQIFYPYNKNKMYKRIWNGSAWGAWEVFSPSITNSVSFDFGTVNAGSTVTQSFTITGVGVNDVVNVNFQYGVANGVIPFAYVSAVDTVVVKLTNVTAANVTVGSRPLRFVVNKV